MVKRIVCFGDSNTHGFDAATEGRFDGNTRWPALLRTLLGPEYEVVEEGMNGRTSVFTDPLHEGRCGIDFITTCLETHEPVSLLVVMLGTNDLKQMYNATPKNVADGVKRLLCKAISVPAWSGGIPRILLICPPHIGKATEQTPIALRMGLGASEKSLQLAPFYQETAKELGCAFLDAGDLETHPADYVHLSKNSHRILAGLVAEKVRSLLK